MRIVKSRYVGGSLIAGLLLLGVFQNCGAPIESAGPCDGGHCSLESSSLGKDQSCEFNGVDVPGNGSISAYRDSAAVDCESVKQIRRCEGGSLTGDYSYAYCTSNLNQKSCLFNGSTILHGTAVDAFMASSAAASASCTTEKRYCDNGVLSGSYTYASCKLDAPRACTFDGKTIAHGNYINAFLKSSASASEGCKSQARTCNDGVMSGTYAYGSCTVDAPRSCLFDDKTVSHGASVTAYLASSVPYNSTCTKQTRTCNDGALSGNYLYAGCAASVARSCLFNSETVAHGSSVQAFAASTVPYGSSCTPESRVCTDGSLSGSALYKTCAVSVAASCLFDGRSVAHGESVSAYASSTVAYGALCNPTVRTCANGVLNGTGAYGSCAVNQPRSCLFNGVTYPHGASVNAYSKASVPFGQQCPSNNLICRDGTLNGATEYPYASCAVGPAAPCVAPDGTTFPSSVTPQSFYLSDVVGNIPDGCNNTGIKKELKCYNGNALWGYPPTAPKKSCVQVPGCTIFSTHAGFGQFNGGFLQTLFLAPGATWTGYRINEGERNAYGITITCLPNSVVRDVTRYSLGPLTTTYLNGYLNYNLSKTVPAGFRSY